MHIKNIALKSFISFVVNCSQNFPFGKKNAKRNKPIIDPHAPKSIKGEFKIAMTSIIKYLILLFITHYRLNFKYIPLTVGVINSSLQIKRQDK